MSRLSTDTRPWYEREIEKRGEIIKRLAARVAELEKGPKFLAIVEGDCTANVHAFSDLYEGQNYAAALSESADVMEVEIDQWTHHPASKPEPEAKS